jgi:hypothetical protein
MPFFDVVGGIGLIGVWRRQENALDFSRAWCSLKSSPLASTASPRTWPSQRSRESLDGNQAARFMPRPPKHRLPGGHHATRVNAALLGAGGNDLRHEQLHGAPPPTWRTIPTTSGTSISARSKTWPLRAPPFWKSLTCGSLPRGDMKDPEKGRS